MVSKVILSPVNRTPVQMCTSMTKCVSPSTTRQPRHDSISGVSRSLLTETYDDENHLKNSRRSRILELQRSDLTSPGATSADRSAAPLNGFTNAQLAEHYSNCIRLSAENKINSKNAFRLHLIDCMADLLRQKELENFQVASSTLDASAKIYAGRVDFIHSETYKVLSGLGTGKDHVQSNITEDDESHDGEFRCVPDEQKKKRKTKRKTIKTNLNSITINNFESEFAADPMLHTVLTTIDDGGSAGLLQNLLHCYDDSQLLVLDPRTVVPIVDCDAFVRPQQRQARVRDVDDIIDLVGKLCLSEKQICPALKDFQRAIRMNDDSTSVISKSYGEFAFNANNAASGETALCDNLVSIPDGPDHDDLENSSDGATDDDLDGGAITDQLTDFQGDVQPADFISSAFADLTHGNTGKLMQILASQPSDYSYFNNIVMRTLVAPSDWKAVSSLTDSTSRARRLHKSKRKRSPFHLTYDMTENLDDKFKSSKTTALSKAAIKKFDMKLTTLPEDLHYKADKLFRLFHKQNNMIKRQENEGITVEEPTGIYDYDNRNDRENFCPDLIDDRENEDDVPEMDFNFSEASHCSSDVFQSQLSLPNFQMRCSEDGFNITRLSGHNLLSQPYKVAKIDIDYARIAKRVDVRKLKSVMWNILTSSSSNQVVSEDTRLSAGRETSMSSEWFLQSLLNATFARVSSNMAKNLSVPIVFVCLLHLANEKVLKISDREMQDLLIAQDFLTSI